MASPSPLSQMVTASDLEDTTDAEPTSIQDTVEENIPNPVIFFPELYLQRQIWVRDILKMEQPKSVLDVGCGEGSLLGILSGPALYLPPPPDGDYSAVPATPLDRQLDYNIYCQSLAGLDITPEDLEHAIAQTAIPDESDVYRAPRWEPLRVQIWKGGLEAFNPEFVDVECVIATEVVEHLPDTILPAFAPMILGAYHPRLFLVTTPNYTYNARFSAPGCHNARSYLDPTGRTDRRFRHLDHKFEWTPEEFRAWCERVATDWGYSVAVSDVGRAQQIDPWGRDGELGGASQTAMFRRRDSADIERKRQAQAETFLSTLGDRSQHELLATHEHQPHPSAKKPVHPAEIADAARGIIKRDRFRPKWTVDGLWTESPEIAILCGGWIEVLITALDAQEDFEIVKDNSRRRREWPVLFAGGIDDTCEDEDEYMPVSVGDVSIDPFESYGWSTPADNDVVQTESEEVGDEPEVHDEWAAGDNSKDAGWQATDDKGGWGNGSTWANNNWDNVHDSKDPTWGLWETEADSKAAEDVEVDAGSNNGKE